MKFSTIITVTVLYLCSAITVTSCNTDRADDPGNQLYYYPSKNIYFDESNAYYYYSLDGGKTWDSAFNKGMDTGTVLGSRIAIEKGEGDVWLNNEEHRTTHNGVMLNIINERTLQLARNDSLARARPVIITSTKSTPVVAEKEPPKKGLKKLFNKVFGKKKKQGE